MFIDTRINSKTAFFTIIITCILWFITFNLRIYNFWESIAFSTVILALLAVIFGGKPFRLEEITLRALFTGISTAVFLYGIFWLGSYLSAQLFNFAPAQITSVYDLTTQKDPWIIALLLIFVTSPAEEIYWRGYLQRWMEQHFKKYPACFICALLYGGIHIFSGNLMLTLAAFVAGLCWGVLYAVEESIVPVIISHILWTVLIFLLFPVPIY